MSSLALMRWLESAPDRYDAGMRWLTLGRAEHLQRALAEAAAPTPGTRVLEIGCGTGAVTERLVGRGASITALDSNPEMLERARQRLADARGGAVAWHERTASEIESVVDGELDAVCASFCLSEMSPSERAFVLRASARVLRPGGILAIADEVRPDGGWRVPFALLRAPQAVAGWLLAGSLSAPIPALAGEIAQAGFAIHSERRWLLRSLALVIGRRE